MGCTSCGIKSGGESGGCGSGGCASGCAKRTAHDWLVVRQPVHGTQPFNVVEVLFKGNRKGYYQNNRGLDIQTGDYIVVEADRGIHFGSVHLTGELVRLRYPVSETKRLKDTPGVVRIARQSDLTRYEENKSFEAETFHVTREMIERLKLPMKLVDVEWQFDRKKATFFFTAAHRVDFRALVRELAKHFHTRVELRQIGARDEAARIGGIGSCGRTLCCSTWLSSFKPVSTQTAKIQNLPLNPVRLSGQCGRLKCCLNYELEHYMKALNEFPAIDTLVETPQGRGSVQKMDIFKNIVWVHYNDGSWEDFPLHELRTYLDTGKHTGASKNSVKRSKVRPAKLSDRPGKRHPN